MVLDAAVSKLESAFKSRVVRDCAVDDVDAFVVVVVINSCDSFSSSKLLLSISFASSTSVVVDVVVFEGLAGSLAPAPAPVPVAQRSYL